MSQATGDASATDTVTCIPDSGVYPVDTYTANLKKPGKNGILTFELVQSEPAPPAQGNNTLTVKITREDGTPFTGTLTAPSNDQGIWMPRHRHGPSVAPVIDSSQGTYMLSSVDLFMTGYWQIRLNAYDATTPTDAGSSETDSSLEGGASMSASQTLIDFGVFDFCVD